MSCVLSLSWPVSLLQTFNKHNPENSKGQQAFLAYGGSMSPTTRSAPCTARASKRHLAQLRWIIVISQKSHWKVGETCYFTYTNQLRCIRIWKMLFDFSSNIPKVTTYIPLLETPDFHMRPKSIGYRLWAGFRNLQKSCKSKISKFGGSISIPLLTWCFMIFWEKLGWFSFRHCAEQL